MPDRSPLMGHPGLGWGQECRVGVTLGCNVLKYFWAPELSLCLRGVSQEKDGQISSAIVSSVQSKITQVRWGLSLFL